MTPTRRDWKNRPSRSAARVFFAAVVGAVLTGGSAEPLRALAPVAALTLDGPAGARWEIPADPSKGESGKIRFDGGLLSDALPLPALRIRPEGEGPVRVRVAPDGGSAPQEMLLSGEPARLPFGIPTVGALRRVVIQVENPEGIALTLEPEEALVLQQSESAKELRFTVTHWGHEGIVEASAVDGAGQPVDLSPDGEDLLPVGSEMGWSFLGYLRPASQASFVLLTTPVTVSPVTVTARTESGETVQGRVYLPEAGYGICATPGKDGAGGTLTGIINTYYPVNASVSAGATSISVGTPQGSSTAISAGDLLLLIQMQDAEINSTNSDSYGDGVSGGSAAGYTAINNAGRYEFLRALSGVASGSVSVMGAGSIGGTLNAYAVAPSTSSRGRRSAQLVRVPQYATATLSSTLTAYGWDGTCGGILALDVSGTLTLGGTVSVDGKGFRGGIQQQLTGQSTPAVASTDFRILGPADSSTTTGTGGMKGEGIAGTPRLMPNANNGGGLDGYPNGDWYRGGPGNAGGGGNDATPTTNNQNAGGGGGGNGGAGGRGGNSWSSNSAIGGFGGATVAAAADRLVLGGGGGAGSRNNVSMGGSGSGAAGGGIVLIRANSISGTGTITANGGAALESQQDAAGGGGGGGTVLVYAASGGLTGLTVNAKGGKGGDSWLSHTAQADQHGPGGGGGGGAILLSASPAATDVSGGSHGVTGYTGGDASFGSTSGSAGTVATNVAGTQIPGVDSGAECSGGSSYITKLSSAGAGYVSPGQPVTYTIRVNNTTSSTWTNVTVTDDLTGTHLTYLADTSQVTYPTDASATYRDQFDAVAYDGSNGSVDWSPTPWTEFNDDSNPATGEVRVLTDTGVTPNRVYSARIQNTSRGIQRSVDLGAAISATLTFDYRRSGFDDSNDWVEVQIRPDAGSAWTALPGGRYAGPTNDSAYQGASFDITPYARATTSIRFISSASLGGGDSFYIDNVQIALTRRTPASGAGGTPPTLASGHTLYPGESLTITFQATVDPNLSNSVTQISNTAYVTADGGFTGSSTATNPVLPAPVVVTPSDGSSTNDTTPTISGTADGSVPVGSTVTITVDGNSYTTTVLSDHTWTLDWPTALSTGAHTVYATVSVGGAVSPLSDTNTFTVDTAPPTVTINQAAGQADPTNLSPVTFTVVFSEAVTGFTASDISFTGSTAPGTLATSISGSGPTYTVTVSGMTGPGTVVASIPAGAAQDLAGNSSAASTSTDNSVTYAVIFPPIVSSSLLAGATSVTGSSVEPPGSTITLYRNGGSPVTTTVGADGSWTVTGLSVLADGEYFYATVTVGGLVSGNSNTVYVAANATSDLTTPPVITGTYTQGDTTVSGTFPPGTSGSTVDVYADGVYLGTTTTGSGGSWSLAGVPALADGAILTATATEAGKGTSDWSGPVIVGTMLMLLRSDAMTSLTQNRAPLFVYAAATPPYPSLQPLGPNHVFNSTEGATGGQPSAPGTSDDDKAYIRDIHSGDVDPDTTVLTDNGRPLVFYELMDNNQKTLKLSKTADGKIQFTITP